MSEKESDAPKSQGPETSPPEKTTASQEATGVDASSPSSQEATAQTDLEKVETSVNTAADDKPVEAASADKPLELAPDEPSSATPEATPATPSIEPTSTESASTESASQDPEPSKTRTPIWLILLAFINLGLIIALAAGYWMDRRDQRDSLQTTQSGIAVLDDRIGRAEGAITGNSDKSRRNASDTARFNQQAARLKKQINHNTDLLAKLPGAERQDWLLAEAEYLMRLSHQRLTLEKDWQGAIAMLVAADKVILETNNPRYDAVRAQLAKEILALRQVPAVDVVGAVNRLQALQNSLEQLDWRPQRSMPELADAASSPEEAAIWFENLWEGVTEQMQRMIVIRFDQKVDIPVGPDQQYQLQYGMHLMLEQAQIAVLRRQQALYDRSLKRIQNWIDGHLINDSASARAVRDTLTELQSWQIDPQMPEVNRSLFMLREILEKQRRGVFDAKKAGQKASKPAAKTAKPAPTQDKSGSTQSKPAEG